MSDSEKNDIQPDDECRRIIAEIFSPPLPPYRERPSGLVEQQRLFRKLR
jgi:hypothetical protein